jgi:eukaryotic-like serine/threonine-protein kinase
VNTVSSQEEVLFADALAQPPAGRAAFLADACGADAALQVRVAALVAAHEHPDKLTIPLAFVRPPLVAEEKTGEWIGRYKLLQKIGEGGCGVVWMAEQEKPVRRRVALKVIKLGMDTKSVIARFEAERQTLAMMDHPNIAKVHDAGATEIGRPFFVMELVRGIAITKYCDENRLTPAARLEVFIKACHAVQHAHQKGIIHRDLKPSNILVTVDDGVPTPKVIDFGIAKATQGRLTDATVFTAFEQFIGTPVYMSPEQAEMSSLDIDTRSDIYSLGILLYELLTGRPPFDPKAFAEAPVESIRQQIRETEPPRPSARVRTLADEERTTIAILRATPPGQLSTLLRGDLDWIVMKAMEKNRTHRYESAAEFAADLKRYLNDEPVSARPPHVMYWAWKFVRRHRLAVAAATAVTVAMAAGTAISLGQAVRARLAERATGAERDRARDERARADDLLTFIVEDLKDPLQRIGELAVLDGVIEKAIQYFTLVDPRHVDDRMLLQQVKVLSQLGGLRMDQARYADAEKAYREAHARALLLVARQPRNPAAWLARADVEWGKGFVGYQSGKYAEAREWFQRERDSRTALVNLQPQERQWQLDLAKQQGNFAALELDNNPEGARASYRAQLGTLMKLLVANPREVEIQRSVANSVAFLGILAEAAGDFAEATQCFAQQLAQFEALERAEPKNRHWQLKQAESLSYHAGTCTIASRRAEAIQDLARARALMTPLVEQDGTNQRWQKALLVIGLKQAHLAQAAREYARAASLASSVRGQLELMAANEPTDVWTHYRLAMALRAEAEVEHAVGGPGAVNMAARAIDVADGLIRREGATAVHRAERAASGIIAGRIAAALGDSAAALAHWQRADALLGPMDEKTTDWRILDPAARLAVLLGQEGRARTYMSQLEKFGYAPLEPWPEPPASISARKI